MLGLFALSAKAVSGRCFVCNKPLPDMAYTRIDQITGQKEVMCPRCSDLPEECHLCTLPVLRDFTELQDGRFFCKRDAKTIVTDEKVAIQLCEQVKQNLDQQFIRFLTFPDTNVTLQVMDKITLQDLFKAASFRCPNVAGLTETKTNAGEQVFTISLMTGLQKEELMSTCVHEHTHTWINANVPPDRQKTLGSDAEEGFCELLSYLYAEQQGLNIARTNILKNRYTRGQIHRFIAAYQTYGLQDIVDWMKQGDDALLMEDLSRVRRLADPPKVVASTKAEPKSKTNDVAQVITNAPPVLAPVRQLPEKLHLQGILWSPTRPMATINGRNFGLQESANVQLRDATVLVRCVAIRPNAVTLQTNNAPDLVVLEMK